MTRKLRIMKTISHNSFAFLFVILAVNTFAQSRLKPGAIYNAGDAIFAPLVGYHGIVPAGWFGTLPQEEEVFMLLPSDNNEGYMFINANHMNLQELRNDWNHALSVTDEIVISLKRAPAMDGNRMYGDFDVTGTRQPFRGYALAMDGGHGWTITVALLAPNDLFEQYKANFDQLVASSKVEAPSLGSRYDDFNWATFLKNKYLMSYLSSTQYSEKNEVWLCADGTFRSKIRDKGMLKTEKKAYKGSNKGSWKAEGIGAQGKLHLYFNKKEDVVLDMEIKDDKIFVNGRRVFALQNDQCK